MCHPSLASNDSSSAPSSGCPVMRKPASKASACPVVQKGGCGSEELNPLNMMPAPNEEPAPGQQGALATERVVSTIPNAEDGKWVYPSPQMFFNALLRKGKGEGIEEDAMDAVVAIHNNMNELTWKRVLEWEKLHCDTCESPKLVRFLGRPDELTPKAFLRYYLGFAPRPFDRHDWTVDRCGTEVRYIIDYYDVVDAHGKDRLPQLEEEGAVPSIWVDVRPALDSPAAAADRMRMMASSSLSSITENIFARHQPDPTDAADLTPAGSATSNSAATGSERVSPSYVDAVRERCADRMEALKACDGDRECALAHIALTMCIADQVCPKEAEAFKGSRASGEDMQANLYGQVEECISRWGQKANSSGAQGAAA